MRRLKVASILAIGILVSATSAHAIVSVVLTSDVDPRFMDIGGTFDVDVSVAYDGNPDLLTSIFVSTAWNPDQLQLNFASDAPPFIFDISAGILTRIIHPSTFPGDPDGTLRTIQFDSPPTVYGSAGGPVLITTLNFTVIGPGLGPVHIDPVFLSGDGIFFDGSQVGPSSYELVGIGIIPEPGVALLLGLGLAGLATAGPRRFRDRR